MEAIPVQEEVAHVGTGCCTGDLAATPGLMHEHECTSAKQTTVAATTRRPARRAPLSSRMSSSLRRSSKDLTASFATSIGESIELRNVDVNKNSYTCRNFADTSPVTVAEVARLVADDYFEEGLGEESPATRSHKLSRRDSSAGYHSRKEAPLVAAEYLRGTKPSDMSLQSNDNIEDPGGINCQERDGTATASSDSVDSMTLFEAIHALEIGISAQDYLEECLYTKVSELDRDKFNSIPEIMKSDFTITAHLGTGSFSDVFEVVCRGGQLCCSKIRHFTSDDTKINSRRSARDRRWTHSSSFNTTPLARPHQSSNPNCVFAMKCLRPQIRSDPDHFSIGAGDLVRETAILATLDHPNIIKLYGRASGNLTDAFMLNDGYFILLDRLNETLEERIRVWKLDPKCVLQGPAVAQIEVAHSVADALSYLHSKKLAFRDLKPNNVGFGATGVLKLFDFGFAIGIPEKDEGNPDGFLYSVCGTRRYMAPEVGLSFGYGLSSDVYSFGVLLWEICALAKPYSYIAASNFERAVFVEGKRPAIEKCWPVALKALIRSCWSDDPGERPTSWVDVKSSLSSAVTNISKKKSRMRTARSRMARRLSDAGWY